MKRTLTLVLLLGIFACTNEDHKSVHHNEKRQFQIESLLSLNSLNTDKNELNNNASSKEKDRCPFDEFISNANTPKLAKDIYLGNPWGLSNDTEALALLDSLEAKNKPSRVFYFKVVTMTYEKSDGYFSEGLGLTGKEYLENNTQEFATYFENKFCFTDNDLRTWADIVLLEIKIEENSITVKKYIEKLKSNCKDCSAAQKSIINKFCSILQTKWDQN